MTHLQKLIRTQVLRDGYLFINVGEGSPATMATIKSLRSAGYHCKRTGQQGATAIWLIEHPAI
jgi:hypothetical protein